MLQFRFSGKLQQMIDNVEILGTFIYCNFQYIYLKQGKRHILINKDIIVINSKAYSCSTKIFV